MKELRTIQEKLLAPKGQHNSYGNYNYRSCEDILKAVKPLLKVTECTLTLQDDVVMIGNRYYIKATATLMNKDGQTMTTSALAREDEVRKGMDGSQITGTASSYARKYALGGLLAIDDTADADALNTNKEFTEKPKAKATKKAATPTTATVATPTDELTTAELFALAKDSVVQANTQEELLEIFKEFVSKNPALGEMLEFKNIFTNRKHQLGL
jgi:hypothetical protein